MLKALHYKKILLFLAITICWLPSLAQQDVEFHVDAHLLPGKVIIKIKRDFNDEYLWVLAENNEVYRINTITKIVDNYSSYFAGYSNFNFIDIAGHTKDQVFIATKNKILQLKNNTIKEIGAAEGLRDEVNSIGIDYTGPFHPGETYSLLIGTALNYYAYKIDTETIVFEAVDARYEIYEASFNKIMFAGTTYAGYGTDLTYTPVAFKVVEGLYMQFLWKNDDYYGQNIKTAYYTFGDISPAYHVPSLLTSSYSNLFWGNENGLFQINRERSYSTAWPGKSYLRGIQVNKISSIYGLTTFGRAGYFNAGLIRENLLVGTEQGLYFSTNMYDFTSGLLHNFTLQQFSALGNLKINDIYINHTSVYPLCEDGAWIATADGLYFIKPDYSSFLSTQTLHAAQFKTLYGIYETEICTETNITAQIEFGIDAGSVQWYKDGNPINAASERELIITEAGEYHAVLYNSCSNVSVKTNPLTVRMIDIPEVALNNADEIKLCPGTGQTLSTVSKPNYIYRWYRNGDVIDGQNTNSYEVTTAGAYKVEVSSCSGTYYPSKEVKIIYTEVPVPVIITDKAQYCTSDVAQLSVAPQQDLDIQWFRDGQEIQGTAGSTSIPAHMAGNYTAKYSSQGRCSETSAAFNLIFNEMPVFNITASAGIKLCNGKETLLTADIAANSYLWSTGETGRSIKVNKSGNFSVQVTSLSGCTGTAEINIEVLPALNLAQIPDAKICTSKGEELIINIAPGYKTYLLNGQSTTASFKIKSPGSYKLVVIDDNGCSAESNFEVLARCPEITIPNAFSPNGDGINDTWTIAGIEGQIRTRLLVYNRYGSLAYQFIGEFKGWDGRNADKELPVGTYYYVLYSENRNTPLKGSVTIVR